MDSDNSSTSPRPSERHGSNPFITVLSPPPAAKSVQTQHKTQFRLRSDSGLALHTNPAAFRQYTAYNNDGSLSTRPCRGRTPSLDATGSVEEHSSGCSPERDVQGFSLNGRVLPDFFEPAVIRLAFSDPCIVRRLRAFAETRYGGPDIDFLQHVEEYSQALECVISSMRVISSRFTGTTATSPLGLPRDVSCSLRADAKYCARTALPALDKLYQEARATTQERLSHNLYPEYVKHKISQCLKDALSTRALGPDTPIPFRGLGEAFCLTDPLQPGNPVIFASDGLIETCGYRREEIVGQNARLFQGVATDPEAVCRLSQAVSSGQEATELVLNYRPDGTPYWNMLFVCPLIENGALRYFLGAQVDISHKMGSDCKDVLAILNYGPAPDDLDAVRTPISPSATVGSRRGSGENGEDTSPGDEQRGAKQPSRRQRFLRRFRRRSPSPKATTPSRGSTASLSTSEDAPGPLLSPRVFPRPVSPFRSLENRVRDTYYHPPQPLDEDSTPYSRFLILRYETCPSPPCPTSAPSTPPPASPRSQSPHTTSRHYHHPPRAQQQVQVQQPERERERRLLTRVPRPNPASTKSKPGKQAKESCPAISLPVAFSSPHALRLLGLGAHEPHAVAGRDIFSVLTSRFGAGAPRQEGVAALRAALARGESVVTDMFVHLPNVPLSRSGSWSGPTSGGSVPGGVRRGGSSGSAKTMATAAARSMTTNETTPTGASGSGLDIPGNGSGSGYLSGYGSSVSNVSTTTTGEGNGNGTASTGSATTGGSASESDGGVGEGAFEEGGMLSV
ncbi:hypothetical protein VTJ49DRAFT_3031 [Mycothermus thermophilus]|uniref:PAS domain-containing protein n=1 Tax=Humicola insolens TaxID=85995 RepID=A0ABR3V8N1_HUMIN